MASELEDRVILRISRTIETEMEKLERNIKGHQGVMVVRMVGILETVSNNLESIIRRRYFSREVEADVERLDEVFESEESSKGSSFASSGRTMSTTLSSFTGANMSSSATASFKSSDFSSVNGEIVLCDTGAARNVKQEMEKAKNNHEDKMKKFGKCLEEIRAITKQLKDIKTKI